MLIVKNALAAKLLADVGAGSITALIGSDRVSQGQLPSAAALPWITFREISSTPDIELPSWNERYQISLWSRSADLNYIVGLRVREILHKKPLATVGGRTWTCLFDSERELTEPEGIHQKSIDFRIGTFA